MIFVIILLLILLIGCLLARRVFPQAAMYLVAGLAALGIILAIVSITRTNREVMHGAESRIGTSFGYVLGRAVTEQFPDGGKVLVIQAPFQSEAFGVVKKAQLEGLKKAFDNKGITVADVRPEPDEQLDALNYEDGLYIPNENLSRYLGGLSDLVAVISFAGLPDIAYRAYPKEAPPLFVADAPDLAACVPWLESGRMGATIVYKHDMDWQQLISKRQSLEEVFNLRHVLITPDNLDEELDKRGY